MFCRRKLLTENSISLETVITGFFINRNSKFEKKRESLGKMLENVFLEIEGNPDRGLAVNFCKKCGEMR